MKKCTTQNALHGNKILQQARLFLVGIFLVSKLVSYAQTKEIKGTVTKENGIPLQGVTVLLKETTQGTITNINGIFTIANVPKNGTLIFSYAGMKTRKIPVANQTVLVITMETNVYGLDDVVSIGYGSVRKNELTGSVANVKAEELMKYQPANVQELLRFAVPGLKAGYSTDAKNSPDFEIRGDNTIKSNQAEERAGNRPLIVLDGTIFNGDLTEINVNDIESVSVLKDAAAAIYGSRSSNGVIIFNTKKGSLGKPKIRVSATYGLVTKGVRNESMKGEEMLDWMVDKQETLTGSFDDVWSVFDDPRKLSGQDIDAWKAANGIPGETGQETINTTWLKTLGFNTDEIMHFNNGSEFDWQNFLFQTGERHDYDLSISGRNEKVSYYWSLGFIDSESLQFNESYQSVTSRLNLNVKVTDFLSAGIYANFAYQDEGDRPNNLGSYHLESPYDTPWEARVWYDETIPKTGKGLHTYPREYLKRKPSGSSSGSNYLAAAYFNRKYDRYSIFPTMFAKSNLPFGITLETKMTTRLDFRRRFEFEESENPEWGHGGRVRRQHYQTYEWLWDNIINWTKEFDQHRFDLNGLISAERRQSWFTDARASDLQPTETLGYHGIGYGIYPVVGSDDQAISRTALMGRVNYAYSNRYNFSTSIRKDGFSAFGANFAHELFPSVSAAWTLTNEAFMDNNPDWIEFLKVRASWGIIGNSNVLSSYSSYSNLNTDKILNWSGGFFTANRLSVASVSNKNLACEKTRSINLAVDYGLWSGRITGSFDVYSSTTTDILLNKKLPVISGFEEILNNTGSLKNMGFDFSINTINIEINDFRWTNSINASYNKNEIVSLTDESDDLDYGWFIGQNKDVIWNYEMGDVYSTDEEDKAAEWGLRPGDFRVVDQNKDDQINSDDKIFQGLSKNPWYITVRNDFTWKNFDMGIVFLSKLGYKGGSSLPFNQSQSYIKSHNWYKNIVYWMPDNQLQNFARINSIRLNSDMRIYVPKDYLRLQNLSIGYNIPATVLESIKVSRARVAFNAGNLFVLTQWYEGDPESNLEMPRIWSFSIDFSF